MPRSASARSRTPARSRRGSAALRRVVVASPDYLARRGAAGAPRTTSRRTTSIVFGGLGRWEFAAQAAGALHAAPHGEHRGGRDRRGRSRASGITRVLSYQAVDALVARRAWCSVLASHAPRRRFRCTCSIRAARIRRPSCAPSSTARCRSCARGSTRSRGRSCAEAASTLTRFNLPLRLCLRKHIGGNSCGCQQLRLAAFG